MVVDIGWGPEARTLWIILDSGQLGTCPKTLRGVEEASLCGRDEADDERAFGRFPIILFF